MWNYTDEVMDHFINPRNVGHVENPDGEAMVGSLSCGDALELSFKLDENKKIKDVKFKTFGCGSAIASSSILTEMVKGKTLKEAEKITNQDIVDALGGLPDKKIHCSVMGMDALHAAIANYRGEKPKDTDETKYEGTVVCHCFDVTDVKIKILAKENNLHSAAEITDYCKAGGACGVCRKEIQQILDGLWEKEAEIKESESHSNKKEMSFAQKIDIVPDEIEIYHNQTLKKWYTWETCLRNRLSKHRAPKLDVDPTIYHREEKDYFSELDRIAQEAMVASTPLEKEKYLDEQRWNYLNGLEAGHIFNFDLVCIYKFRLILCEKWLDRQTEKGKENFDKALDSLYTQDMLEIK